MHLCVEHLKTTCLCLENCWPSREHTSAKQTSFVRGPFAKKPDELKTEQQEQWISHSSLDLVGK